MNTIESNNYKEWVLWAKHKESMKWAMDEVAVKWNNHASVQNETTNLIMSYI